MIWYWHAGEGVLVHVDHDKKTATGLKAAILRHWVFPDGSRWSIGDSDMAKSLPRFQPPQPPRIQPASKALMAHEIRARGIQLK
jgi:hypothetical protein